MSRDLIAYVAGLGIGAAFLLIAGLPSMHDPHGTDLANIWAGPHLILEGGNPYDPIAWRVSVERVGVWIPDGAIYAYPPHVALALLPIGALPLEVVDELWLWGSLAATVVVAGALLRRFLPGVALAHGAVGLALLTSQPAAQALFNLNWGFWLFGICGYIVLSIDRAHGARAGAAAAMLLLKPQLFVLALPALVLHAAPAIRGRMTKALLISALTWIGASLIARPDWWGSWISAIAVRANEPNIATLPTAAGDLFGLPGRLLALTILAGSALVVLRRGGTSSLLWPAAAIALSLAGAPFARSYDQVLLFVSIVLVGGELARRGDQARAQLAVVAGALGLVVLSWSLRLLVAGPLESEAVLGLVSASVAALVVVVAVTGPETPVAS